MKNVDVPDEWTFPEGELAVSSDWEKRWSKAEWILATEDIEFLSFYNYRT